LDALRAPIKKPREALVQAMAGLGGGAADDSYDVSLGDDASLPFLTTPQHA